MGRNGSIDDARHAVLSRARPLAQVSLEAAVQGDGRRASGGGLGLLEVDAKAALTPFGMGSGWSLNPYVGCSHACLYCYVPDVVRVERPRWGSYVIVKRNLPTLLSHELRAKPRDEIFLSSATDPYQWAEGHARITRLCLEVLTRFPWPLRVLTRSPLVVRDVDLLRRLPELQVGLSIPTFDEAARRILEPSAPPIEARLRALGRLANAGLPTYVSFAPAYPPTGGVTPEDIASRLADAGVLQVFAGRWNYLDSIRAVLAERTRGTPLEGLAMLVEDWPYYRHFFRRMRNACARRGIALHTYDDGGSGSRSPIRAAASSAPHPFGAIRGVAPASGWTQ